VTDRPATPFQELRALEEKIRLTMFSAEHTQVRLERAGTTPDILEVVVILDHVQVKLEECLNMLEDARTVEKRSRKA
jgi:hypothetical protein